MARLKSAAARFKHCAEYVSGSRDSCDAAMPWLSSIFWGVWWGFLLYTIIMFCGQTSKFIYIDF